jgi:murein DD-endopeptidase MepM/ murein hydrolase activator NlpD
VARHRSPQGRRAHLEPPLSASVAAAGAGGAHRSISVPQLTPSLPTRFVATVVVGGALAATAQHALAQSFPGASDGAALRIALEELVSGGEEAAAALPAELDATTGAALSAPFDTASLVTEALDTGAVLAPAIAPVAPASAADTAQLPADVQVADAASLVKAADLHQVAADAARAAEQARVAAEAARAAEAAEAARAAEAAPAAVGGALEMVSGRVTSGFGARWGRAHQGLDIAAPIGTPIRAPLAGTVIDSGPASGFGMWVRVRHSDGTVTVYGHINRSHVRKGQEVAAGEVIAEVGNRGRSTGPHLHIEVVTPGGKKINPRPWLDERGIVF